MKLASKAPKQRQPPLYEHHTFPVNIRLVWDESAWNRGMLGMKLEKRFPQSAGSVTVFSCDGAHDEVWITFTPDALLRPNYDEVVGLIAHECIHVLQNVEQAIGGRLGREGQAYFVQGLLQWILREIQAVRWPKGRPTKVGKPSR